MFSFWSIGQSFLRQVFLFRDCDTTGKVLNSFKAFTYVNGHIMDEKFTNPFKTFYMYKEHQHLPIACDIGFQCISGDVLHFLVLHLFRFSCLYTSLAIYG